MQNTVRRKVFAAEAALLMTAVFWGLCLVCQRVGLDYMSPMAYLGLRFIVGAILLLPVAVRRFKRQLAEAPDPGAARKGALSGCLVAGGLMWVGGALQQYGMQWTTVAKTGFITSLYVVIVPLLLFLAGRRIGPGEVAGAVLAVIGLFLLSFDGGVALSRGDFLMLLGAVAWAGHVICVGVLSPRMDAFVFCAGQSLAAGVLAVASMAFLGETPGLATLAASWHIVLLGGLLSVTLGYTLQIYGQREASPTVAAILLQLEAVFAAFTAWIFLGEGMTVRMIAGAAIMFSGALIIQVWPAQTEKAR